MDRDADLPPLPILPPNHSQLFSPGPGAMPEPMLMPTPTLSSSGQAVAPDTNHKRSPPSSSSSESATAINNTHKKKDKGKEKEQHVPTNVRDLAKLLAYEQRETKELHRMLFTLTEQLELERQRANDAERRLAEAIDRLKSVNESRLSAVRDASLANEQLKLYKAQLDLAQKEIFRAQEILDAVDQRRYDAEKESARARTAVRRMNEEMLVWNAREQGRRAGIKEGLKRGRDIGYREGTRKPRSRRDTYTTNYTTTDGVTTDGEDQQEYYYGPESMSDSHSMVEEEPEPPRFYRAKDIGLVSPRREPGPSLVAPGAPQAQLNPTSSPRPSSYRSPAPDRRRSPLPDQNVNRVPTPIYNAHPSPNHPAVTIPPDNWIPSTGRDGVVRLPPPHEMSHPPPTPQRTPSPQLPKAVDEDIPPLVVPAPHYRGSQGFRSPEPVIVNMMHHTRPPNHRRQSSPESSHGSTTMSQFEMLNEAPVSYGRRSPLSDIAEVLSVNTNSPNPDPNGSFSSPAIHRTLSPSIHVTPADPYTRSRSPDSFMSASMQQQQQPKQRRGSISSANTVPDITIQPPSRPPSNGYTPPHASPRSPRATRSMGNLLSPLDAHRQLASPPAVPQVVQPSMSAPMAEQMHHKPPPSAYDPPPNIPMQSQFYPTPETPHERPVIPDPSLYKPNAVDESYSSSETVTSGDTLTTPPPRRLKLASSVGHGGLGGGYMNISAAGVPLPESTVGTATPKSMAGTMFSALSGKSRKSKKGSVSSRNG